VSPDPFRSLPFVLSKRKGSERVVNIRLRRAYEAPSPDDGTRILVERLWPRGLGKERAAVDVWLKEIAPSTGLRRWFGHDAAKWEEFQSRYRDELSERPEQLERLRRLVEAGPVTFVYGSRDREHNAATALRDLVESESVKERNGTAA
jgi:uncharacterized protein YeaO (DUF488 family)